MRFLSVSFTFIFIFASLLSGGCANHIKNIETTTIGEDKKILNTKYELKLSPDTIKGSSFQVEIQKVEFCEIKKYKLNTIKSHETPYSGKKELYEIPAGIGLLPVSIGAHLLFICSFGMFPYDYPQLINNYAFTGLNPALNWEDEKRSIEKVVRIDRDLTSHVNETLKDPLAQNNIVVQAGNMQKTFFTDEFGVFELKFLSLKENDSFLPGSRKLSITLEGNKKICLKQLLLPRNYLSKINQARLEIDEYSKNPSGKKLFDTVISLERQGFDELAYMLEESEIAKFSGNKQFQLDFQAANSQ